MKTVDRKARMREYKETRRPAGVYGVRNKTNGRMLLGVSSDLPGVFNRQRFQLENGAHPDRELQQDWNNFGSDAFAFEILDELEPLTEAGYDPAEDLRVLKQMWLEKLTASNEPLYPWSRRGT